VGREWTNGPKGCTKAWESSKNGEARAVAPRRSRFFSALLAVVAVVFFALAVSRAVYDITSPADWPFHVLLRKSYSLIAFAIVGYLYAEAGAERGRAIPAPTAGIVTAIYSAAIEVGQRLVGSTEGLLSNGIDVACGLVGGAIGAALAAVRRRLAA